MQGAGAHTERLLLLRGQEIGLRFDDGFPDNPALLTGALDTTRVEVWTGVVFDQVTPLWCTRSWCNPARFDEILTAHLPRLVDDLGGLVGLWWVRRHRDMIRSETDQHLAVFLRLTGPEQYGPAAAGLAAFAADLHTRGLPGQLTLASHPQHPARYGEGPALAVAEQVFATDTAAAIAQIASAEASGV